MIRRICSCTNRLFFVLIAVISLMSSSRNAFAQFETRATAILPPGAFAIAGGDFNKDGYYDVVIIDDNGFTVSLGKGDGTFQKYSYYATTQITYSVAVGDINNDGNLDIVFANLEPASVTVYLGKGDGTFQPPVSTNTTASAYFVAVGDFNNDKKLDLAIVDPPYTSVLLGNGDGTFQTPNDNDSFLGGIWLTVGDFNNDHKLDVVITGSFGSSYSVGTLLGNGDGTLQDSILTPLPYVPETVAAADLNDDGKLDAIIGDQLTGLTILLGNGDGTFQSPANYETTSIGNGVVTVSDLNLDGKLDVAVPSGGHGATEGIDVFWGNGDGTLQPAQFFSTGTYTGLPAVGDLNGDGLPDFSFANSAYGTVTTLNTAIVSFSPNTAPLTFPVQLIGTSSQPQTVKLTNNGTKNLSIKSVQLSGPFQMSNKCGSSIAPKGSCSISVLFKPKSAGTVAGLITIIDSASSKPQFIELSGSATIIKVSPATLNFGDVKVGKTSAPQTVTATNEGTTAVRFSSVSVTAKQKDFSSTGNCIGQSIQPGSSCQMSVIFHPTTTGTRTADLYFDLPNGSISPAPVALSGVGTN
jgi:hypothetical protein